MGQAMEKRTQMPMNIASSRMPRVAKAAPRTAQSRFWLWNTALRMKPTISPASARATNSMAARIRATKSTSTSQISGQPSLR